MLQEPEEEQSSPARVTAVEAEGKFIEVGVQMLSGHRTLVGAKQPAFEQRSNGMHPRHGNVCRVPGAGNVDWVVPVSLLGKAVVAFPPVGAHLRAGFDRGRDKGDQAGARHVMDTLQTRAAEPFGDNTSMAIATMNLQSAPRPRTPCAMQPT